jgi:hypothetical protein
MLPVEKEAANRAEVTALLIRAGYRVYRPEADCYGEDLILRTPKREFRAVQLKSRPEVDWKRYGRKSLWMLFPDPKGSGARKWFLVPHDEFYEWIKGKHPHARKFKQTQAWNYPFISKELARFLSDEFAIVPHRAAVKPGWRGGKVRAKKQSKAKLSPIGKLSAASRQREKRGK